VIKVDGDCVPSVLSGDGVLVECDLGSGYIDDFVVVDAESNVVVDVAETGGLFGEKFVFFCESMGFK